MFLYVLLEGGQWADHKFAGDTFPDSSIDMAIRNQLFICGTLGTLEKAIIFAFYKVHRHDYVSSYLLRWVFLGMGILEIILKKKPLLPFFQGNLHNNVTSIFVT